MSKKTTFEQLCSGKTGYSCDESSMTRLTKDESFNDLIFKVLTKCETNMIFLPSPTCTIKQFTIDIIPDFTNASLESTWSTCGKQGYDGMNVLAVLDPSNMPETSTDRYTFSQFIYYVIHKLEGHFMFQKDYPLFSVNTLNLWKGRSRFPIEDAAMRSCAVILAWKFDRKSLEDVISRSPLSQLNSSNRVEGETLTLKLGTKTKSTSTLIDNTEDKRRKTEDKRRKTLTASEVSTPVTSGRKGRRSVPEPPANEVTYDSADEDPEISFKKKPEEIIPQVRYLKNMTPTKTAVSEEPMETEKPVPEPIAMEDVVLGFERSTPAKGGRKSTARKSLLPDWPDEEKQHALDFFDNLNPDKAEQTRVALTCKFAQMQYGRELPSKLLYQWIQKKGRPVNRTITSFEIAEAEQNKATLDLYKQLNPETSDVSRVAFICKFVNMQYGISLTSREFNDLLNGKVKKTPKRR